MRYSRPPSTDSTCPVIHDALILRREPQSDDIFGYVADEIDRLADEGIESGLGREIDIEEIKREGFRRAGVPHPGS